MHRVYNPIDPALQPDATAVNPDQLIFISSAYKGLDQVLRNFGTVRQVLPQLELLIAGNEEESLRRHPVYGPALAEQSGMRMLGRLPQEQVLEHVRRSLCVFYTQNVHAETFRVVFAEVNAVGTPVLAHDFGAAREVLGGEEQLVDADDADAVAAKLVAWRSGGRPRVGPDDRFSIRAVSAEWLRLFEQRR